MLFRKYLQGLRDVAKAPFMPATVKVKVSTLSLDNELPVTAFEFAGITLLNMERGRHPYVSYAGDAPKTTTLRQYNVKLNPEASPYRVDGQEGHSSTLYVAWGLGHDSFLAVTNCFPDPEEARSDIILWAALGNPPITLEASRKTIRALQAILRADFERTYDQGEG